MIGYVYGARDLIFGMMCRIWMDKAGGQCRAKRTKTRIGLYRLHLHALIAPSAPMVRMGNGGCNAYVLRIFYPSGVQRLGFV